MKKILITGAYGQLGSELSLLLGNDKDVELIKTDVDTLDICNGKKVEACIVKHQPDFVINCAAYTAVDQAEQDVDKAQKLNVDAVGNLAKACKKSGAKMIHISTDYVFNGKAHTPYKEHRTVCPQSVYGRTKAEGEKMLRTILPNAIIVRTAWLYSTFGRNFVKTMINLGSTRKEINVVADQFGTPTYAADLADALVKIINYPTWHPGIYHFTNEGFATWYDFASAIMLMNNLPCKVNPIPTSGYPTPAQRPAYSVLSKQKIKDTFGINPPHWLEALSRCVKLLNPEK